MFIVEDYEEIARQIKRIQTEEAIPEPPDVADLQAVELICDVANTGWD